MNVQDLTTKAKMNEYLSKEKNGPQEVRSVQLSRDILDSAPCTGRGWGQAAGEDPRPVQGGLSCLSICMSVSLYVCLSVYQSVYSGERVPES